MVELTRLDGTTVVLNADLIEMIESIPETMISLTSNKRVTVLEPVDEVVDRVMRYQRAIRGPVHDRALLR